MYETVKKTANYIPGLNPGSSYEQSQNPEQKVKESMKKVNKQLDRARAVNEVLGESMERFLEGSCEEGFDQPTDEELERIAEEKILGL